MKTDKQNKKEFSAGFLCAVQEVVSYSHENLAIQILRTAGGTRKEWLKLQKESGHNTRKMNQIIRYTFD